MNDLLKYIPDWAIGLCTVAGIGLIIFLILKNKLSINFKGIKVNEDEDHLYLIISKAIQLSDEKRDIKIKLRADDQMRYAKARREDVYAMIMRTYRMLLKEKGIADPMDSREYKIYSQNIELMLNKILVFLYDHFETMNRDYNLNNIKNTEFCLDFIRKDYEILRNNSVNAIVQKGTDLITDAWVPIDTLSRDEVHEFNDPIMVDIENAIGDVFDKAISIQLSYCRRLFEIDNELKDYIDKVKKGEE
jgi:hypothetical protein